MDKTATIRLDEALLKEARSFGVNVSEAARRGIEDAVRIQKTLRNLEFVRSRAVKADEPSEAYFRRMRDEQAKKWGGHG